MNNKSFIPNIFTFCNLSFGMLSILFTLTGNTKTAVLMVIIAALIDRYDGRIARLVNASSPLGKELDSLADLISFGAAPAILSWSNFLIDYGVFGYIVSIIFPIAGAYRLARFNVAQSNDIFTGVPITIAGSLLAIINFILMSITAQAYLSIIEIVFILLLSYLMISKYKFKKI
jgi:CDP-diacylglycerol--serine O-phosphatidyltransferase